MMTTTIRASRALLAACLLTAASVPVLAQGQQDFSKVEIKTNKVSSNFYTLDGQGGTIGVLTGPDGVFMVDAQFAPLTDKIVAAIKQISDGRIRFLVNTHVHGDHTGGNENLGKMGVTILARENLRMRLEKPNPGANGAPGVPMPAAGLPVITYDAPDHDPHERRRSAADSGAGRAHRRRHVRQVRERRRHHDRRLLPLDPVSQHRSRQRRIAAGPDQRARRRHRRTRVRTRRSFPATVRPWTATP